MKNNNLLCGLLTLAIGSTSTLANEDEKLVDWNCGVHEVSPTDTALPLRQASHETLRGVGSDPGLEGSAPANRVDLVFVGDGYTAAELVNYENRVNVLVNELFTDVPYSTYENYFNVHRVDVISNESGVDNDPSQGIQRDTELNMEFWCGGTSHRLCVATNLAWAYAANAPAADTLVAVANSNKYGGAGYFGSGTSTVSSSNSSSKEILKHELGHGFGRLGDEYFTAGTTAPPGDPGRPNISNLDTDQMEASGAHWARWIGFDEVGLDGPVRSYQGAQYYQFGLYRPSPNSLMRSLGRANSAPNVEALVVQIYRHVSPIDASSDPNLIHDEQATLFVTPMQPMGHDLQVTWSLDGDPIDGFSSHELELCSLGLSAGWHAVEVTVVDNTPLVRDEGARAELMTKSLLFPVFSNGSTAAEVYCTSAPNSVGPGAHIGFEGLTSLSANQLSLTVTGGVPGTPGLFLSGTEDLELPFGDGYRCAGGDVLRFTPLITGVSGELQQALDLGDLPNGASLQVGDVRKFQFWYRDPAAGGAGFNLSNALSLVFCP